MQKQNYLNLYLQGLFAPILIYNVEIHQEINQHATLHLEAMIKDGYEDMFIFERKEFQSIKLFQEGIQHPLYCGLAKNIEIKSIKGVYYLFIDAISYTWNMDIKKQSQSFQEITQKYKFIYSEIMSKYLSHQEIFTYHQVEDTFSKLIIQYKETDWEFLKRIASHHNVGLTPDISQANIAYYAGLPIGENYEINNIPYKIERVPQRINALLLNKRIANADENDFLTYEFQNMMEYFKIGDNIIFKNLEWRIKSIYSHLSTKDNYLLHDYTITRESGCKQPYLINEQFVGASIEGIVIDRGHGYAKLHLEIDEIQDINKASWLRYSNYYTAGDYKGWTGMPEIGDQLSLHFPCEEENESYILDSIGQSYNLTENRLAGLEMVGATDTKGKMSQTPIKNRDKAINHGPLPKYIRAPNGQELKIEQTHIIMSSAESMATLLIHQDKGITYFSESDISVRSFNDINIGKPLENSDDEPSLQVQLHADTKTELICGLSSIKMKEGRTEFVALDIIEVID